MRFLIFNFITVALSCAVIPLAIMIVSKRSFGVGLSVVLVTLNSLAVIAFWAFLYGLFKSEDTFGQPSWISLGVAVGGITTWGILRGAPFSSTAPSAEPASESAPAGSIAIIATPPALEVAVPPQSNRESPTRRSAKRYNENWVVAGFALSLIALGVAVGTLLGPAEEAAIESATNRSSSTHLPTIPQPALIRNDSQSATSGGQGSENSTPFSSPEFGIRASIPEGWDQVQGVSDSTVLKFARRGEGESLARTALLRIPK